MAALQYLFIIMLSLRNFEFQRIAYFVAKVEEKTMSNKKFWVGMLVMVLVFGMSVVGCGGSRLQGTWHDGGSTFIEFGTNTVAENFELMNARRGTYTTRGNNGKKDI